MSKTKVKLDIIDRFLSKVLVDNLTLCWNWTGAITYSGVSTFKWCRNHYGSFRANGRSQRAHRFAFSHWRPKRASNLDLHHKCFNTLCVNPWHLEPMTKKENNKKKRKKSLDKIEAGV